jgi:PAS domain S-box-containing protein
MREHLDLVLLSIWPDEGISTAWLAGCLLLVGGSLAIFAAWQKRQRPAGNSVARGQPPAWLAEVQGEGGWNLLERAPLAMLLCNRRGEILLVNGEAETLFGHRREALLGQSLQMLTPQRYRARQQRIWQAFFAAPQSRPRVTPRELTALRADGREIPLEVRFGALHADGADVVLAALVDITERKRATRRAVRDETQVLSRTNDALERTNTDLQQFAFIASHDLQEPLRKMASFSELLAQKYHGRLDEDADRYIHYIVDGAKRMRLLISDLLSFSRVERKPIKFEPLSLNEVVDQAIEYLTMSIQETGAKVTRDTLPQIPGDAELLAQVFQNLIGNAIKFCRLDVPVAVHVGVEADGKDWVISVRDNGIGIEPAYLEQIFVIFKRLHSQAEYPGTGIGLAISKKVVERHGGTLTVASEPGKGSVFFIRVSQIGGRLHDSTDIPTRAAHD